MPRPTSVTSEQEAVFPLDEGGGPSLVALAELRERVGAERWRAVSDPAQVVACYLACHPRVTEVRYPGLKGDPSFVEAANTLRGGFGPWVCYHVAGERGWRSLVCDNTDALEQVGALEEGLREAQAC